MMIQPAEQEVSDQETWPPEADLILSALNAGQFGSTDRRNGQRVPYRVRALFRMFSDRPETPSCRLFVRDINDRGLGFISPDRISLGHGGQVEIVSPKGRMMKIHSTLLRCRELAPGWFEGAVRFNRPQAVFGTE